MLSSCDTRTCNLVMGCFGFPLIESTNMICVEEE